MYVFKNDYPSDNQILIDLDNNIKKSVAGYPVGAIKILFALLTKVVNVQQFSELYKVYEETSILHKDVLQTIRGKTLPKHLPKECPAKVALVAYAYLNHTVNIVPLLSITTKNIVNKAISAPSVAESLRALYGGFSTEIYSTIIVALGEESLADDLLAGKSIAVNTSTAGVADDIIYVSTKHDIAKVILGAAIVSKVAAITIQLRKVDE